MENLDAALLRGAAASRAPEGLADRILRAWETVGEAEASAVGRQRTRMAATRWAMAAAGAAAAILWVFRPALIEPDPAIENPSDAIGALAWASAAVDLASRMSEWSDAPAAVLSSEMARQTARMAAGAFSVESWFPISETPGL